MAICSGVACSRSTTSSHAFHSSDSLVKPCSLMASPGAVAAVLAGCGAGGVAAARAGRLAWACIAFRPATSRT